ncbi:peroxiredoxin [Lichenibacterium minor]|uniref:Glutathione-dependent peroxiredoxin n=1 Tax=Lichenibacterium minor TaxID=2316528 RepID=A0A4Q2U9L9_9HYPH|nr:peroxiredoxin [Lichenibacterium minor]RYC33529.1 peroxiredoxin [Lichenibacterium minor]
MAIQPGDRLPQVDFFVTTPDGLDTRSTADVFGGRRVVLVGVPGAFTPTCDRNHLPGFVEHADAILATGVDAIAVTAVNDAFVLKAWAAKADPDGRISFLGDGNGTFARAIGLEADGSARGFGTRSQRYAMIVEDGVVTSLSLEEVRGAVGVSGAEAVLAALGAPAPRVPTP